MKTNPALDQVNLSYGSAEKLKLDSKRIKAFFAEGRPVWIGRNGYGSSQYAMLNCQRWNATAGNYIQSFEPNGLPASWDSAIKAIIYT